MRMRTVAAVLLALAACVPEQGPLMAAGRDCLTCHDGRSARQWTAAGTWGGQGSNVTLTDATGKSFMLRTNQVGNFYTAESLSFPLQVSVDGKAMPNAVTYGGCNKCHAGGGLLETGPNMLPGSDCLTCHDGNGVKLFTAAGTWSGPGLSVRLVDSGGKSVSGGTLVTNQVGNFYTSEPLGFPMRSATVGGGQGMTNVPYGGCNACHAGGASGDGGGN